MTNNRLQMLVRVAMATSQGKTVDEIVAVLSTNLCAEEFIYDAFSEMRREGYIEITGLNGRKEARFTEMGKRVLEFDIKIIAKLTAIQNGVMTEAGG